MVLPSFHHDFCLPDVGTESYNNITGNIVSMIQIGGLLGSMATFPLMKGKGRKVSLIVASVIYAIGAVLQVSFTLDDTIICSSVPLNAKLR